MRDHHVDAEEAALRPKAARLDELVGEQAGRAAAEGRTDVLDPTALLRLQRAAGNEGVAGLVGEDRSPVHDVVGSGGRPLEDPVRADMEGRFGQDFSDVRVHDDGAAHDSAEAVNADAYTVGSDIVFQRDRYDPASDAGRTMLAHELTHVVQQRSGPVDGSPAAGGINLSDPSDRFEREAAANAERVVSAPAAGPSAAPSATPAPVQRYAEDEPVVQRQDAPVEEEREDEEPPTAQAWSADGPAVQRDAEEEREDEPV